MKILIVEDEADIRQTLRDILELNGHTVLAAADGAEALRLAEQRPDFVFCDIGLPGTDGFGVFTAMQQLPHGTEVPFVFLTARADRADQRRGMALGADDYITKPFTEQEILDALAARTLRQRPLRERIERLMDEKRRAATADWSHELMTPLHSVLGGLEMIEMEGAGITPTELRELLELIRQGATRQQRLSRKLIRYFELQRLLESPRPAVRPRCEAEDAVQAGAMRAATDAGREDDLRLEIESGVVGLPGEVLVDAVAELVDNGCRFSKRGKEVSVQAASHDGEYHLRICDAGPGMTAEQRERVGAFVQFDRRRLEQQGLGLGLAIAGLAAKLGGGTMSLGVPVEGTGLQVKIRLPLVS